jgi:hypothetical protein
MLLLLTTTVMKIWKNLQTKYIRKESRRRRRASETRKIGRIGLLHVDVPDPHPGDTMRTTNVRLPILQQLHHQ